MLIDSLNAFIDVPPEVLLQEAKRKQVKLVNTKRHCPPKDESDEVIVIILCNIYF